MFAAPHGPQPVPHWDGASTSVCSAIRFRIWGLNPVMRIHMLNRPVDLRNCHTRVWSSAAATRIDAWSLLPEDRATRATDFHPGWRRRPSWSPGARILSRTRTHGNPFPHSSLDSLVWQIRARAQRRHLLTFGNARRLNPTFSIPVDRNPQRQPGLRCWFGRSATLGAYEPIPETLTPTLSLEGKGGYWGGLQAKCDC